VIAYLSGFTPTAILVALALVSLAASQDSPDDLGAMLAYRAGRQIIPTVAGAFLTPVGAGAVAWTAALGEMSGPDGNAQLNSSAAMRALLEPAPADVLGFAMDAAIFLPLAGIWWGRGRRLKKAKRALLAPSKAV
jgi:hypothetical protein